MPIISGPRRPVSGNFKEDTEEESSEKTFKEDESETESDDGDSSISYAMKATTKGVKSDKKVEEEVEIFEISDDSELERSMIEIEAAISLEFSDSE